MPAILGASKVGLLWPCNEWGHGTYQLLPVLICFMCMLNYNAFERWNLRVETPAVGLGYRHTHPHLALRF